MWITTATQAASITVDGSCTLVDAITAANNDAATGNCAGGDGADTITLSVPVTLTVANNGDNGLPLVTSEIIIEGSLYPITRESTADQFRIFDVDGAGTLRLNRVIMVGGDAPDSGGGIANAGTLIVNDSFLLRNQTTVDGGAIYNSGMVTITDSLLQDNYAIDDGAGVYNSSGTVVIWNSTLSSNRAADRGGALYNGDTLLLANSTVSGNTANGDGGAIYSSGTLTITHSTLIGNIASQRGGGLYLSSSSDSIVLNRALLAGNIGSNGNNLYTSGAPITADLYNLFGHSGDSGLVGLTPGTTDIVPGVSLAAVLKPTLADNLGGTLTHELVSGSPAIDAAGDGGLGTDQRGMPRPLGAADDIGAVESGEARLNNRDCYLVEAIVAANTDSAVGSCVAGSGADTITILRPVTLTAAYTGTSNGLPVITSTITLEGEGYTLARDQSASQFRMLEVGAAGIALLNQVTIQGASIDTASGSGIHNSGTLLIRSSTIRHNRLGGAACYGSGIYNSGTLTIANSTISNNESVCYYNYGGGIYNIGTITLTNSTISHNNAGGADDGFGGGISNANAFMTIINSTISSNSVYGYYSGGGGVFNTGTITLTRSLITGNTSEAGGAEIQNNGTLAANQYNLVGYSGDSRSGGFTPDATDIVPTVALASILTTTLADNGGGTWTHALAPFSPAIDAAASGSLATDQRGVARPQGLADDIGAVEQHINSRLAVVGTPATEYDNNTDSLYPTQSAAGVYTITATFRNEFTTTSNLQEVYFQVKQIGHVNGNNYLLNANGGPGQVGAQMIISNEQLPGSNSTWDENEDLPATFVLGLTERRWFTLLVDVYGSHVITAAANRTAFPTDGYLGSFVFTFDPTQDVESQLQRLFLPFVQR